jgi:uncharacterized membrane protein YphA (DoxX/SURF4 family)
VLPPNQLLLARIAISAVWFYQGFWCKVLGRVARHVRVVESAPVFNPRSARRFLLALGWFETFLGVWVLTGAFARSAATVEIALLAAMNTGGLLWARSIIPDPAGMVFQNFALAVLIWICR